MRGFLADENFHNDVFRGLIKGSPELDIDRVQEFGLRGADDPTILSWAAEHGLVLLTHDRETMPGFAYDRVRAGLPMPGVLVVDTRLSIGATVEQILLAIGGSLEGEWENQVRYIPV